ncbi:MAG: 16S rRNA (cytosine(1402)-N(4))-methyltransferase RsmH [Balneolales bacterium]
MTKSSLYHDPVLLEESVTHLITDQNGIYVDGTVGGGGHSALILSKLGSEAILYGIDQDDDALQTVSERFKDDPRFKAVKGNFGYIDAVLPVSASGNLSGILLDLGVSSHQINEPARGFSFQQEGPLDMRMSNMQGLTAQKVVNEYGYKELRDIFYRFGEEKNSPKIAAMIVERRPFSTTLELKDAIASVTPDYFQVKTLARIFQALRIEVNHELDMLGRVLEAGTSMLKDKGRFVVISYHSLEDRPVKSYFKTGNLEGKLEKDFYGNDIKPLNVVFNKIITPGEEEKKNNPRARSARLRAAEKTELPS